MSFVTLRGVALVISAVPMVVYPGVLIAGVMALGAGGGDIGFNLFIYYGLLYPLAWYAAARVVKLMPPNALPTAAIALLPVVVLTALAAFNNVLPEIAQGIWAVIT